MNLADVISLAKAGYKKKDIDELLSIEVPEEKQEPDQGEIKEDKNEPATIPDVSEEPNYKELYEQEKETNEKIRLQLSNAQKETIHQDLSSQDKNSDEETLIDLIKNFR